MISTQLQRAFNYTARQHGHCRTAWECRFQPDFNIVSCMTSMRRCNDVVFSCENDVGNTTSMRRCIEVSRRRNVISTLYPRWNDVTCEKMPAWKTITNRMNWSREVSICCGKIQNSPGGTTFWAFTLLSSFVVTGCGVHSPDLIYPQSGIRTLFYLSKLALSWPD